MSRPGTAGIADYFAILGVGDTLVLKSTQKSNGIVEDEAPPPATDASDAGAGADASTALAGTTTETSAADTDRPMEADLDRCFGTVEEESAWTERFYREIVDVNLVTAAVENEEEEEERVVAGADASSAAVGSGEGNNRADVNGGYEVIRRTAAALAPMMTVRMGKVTAEEQGRDADLNPMSPGGLRSAVLLSEQELAAARSNAPGNTAGDDGGGINRTPSKVLSGLKSKVGTKLGKINPILQGSASQEWLHGAMSTSPRMLSSNSGVGGNVPAAMSPSYRVGKYSSRRRRTYHVAFRRRGPDEMERPAVADVAVRFVRIHRSTVVREDCRTYQMRSPREASELNAESKSSGVTASTSMADLAKRGLASGAGLAAQMAVSGANRLMASRSSLNSPGKQTGESVRAIHSPREATPRMSRKHFFPDTVEKPPRGPDGGQQVSMTPFQLTDVLELPNGYDEWSIPEPFQSLAFPSSVDDDARVDISSAKTRPTSPEARLRRTVLFSHSSSALEADLSPSEASGAGIEAQFRTNSPNLSVTSSRGPSPLGTDQYISQMPNALSMEEKEAERSDERSLEALVPRLLAPDSIPTPSEGDTLYEYVPILAIRRQRVGEEERYREDPAAVDISVSFLECNERAKMFGLGEGNDDDYEEEDEEDEAGGALSVLRKTGWKVAADTFLSSRRHKLQRSEKEDEGKLTDSKLTGTPVLLLRHNTPQGFADAPFATSVLDRFPSKNYKGLPMPEEELPMFCYPTGCRLHRAKFHDAPLAQCYGFVVKNEQGDSIHGELIGRIALMAASCSNVCYYFCLSLCRHSTCSESNSFPHNIHLPITSLLTKSFMRFFHGAFDKRKIQTVGCYDDAKTPNIIAAPAFLSAKKRKNEERTGGSSGRDRSGSPATKWCQCWE